MTKLIVFELHGTQNIKIPRFLIFQAFSKVALDVLERARAVLDELLAVLDCAR